jgi:CRP/FNR family transcriptional regulator, nitrogen oxide reductase regulator
MRVAAPLDLTVELRRIQLFAELPRHSFTDLAGRAQLTRVDRDRPLAVEGEVLAGIPIVLNGLVKLTMGRLLVDVFRGPCVLVPSASVDGASSPVSAIAMRTCDVATIDRAAFLSAITGSPATAQRLADLVAREARAYLRRFPELVGGSVEERLIGLLDRLSERHGSPLDDGRYMALPLRRCDLAMMVHATTETVSRTLAEWERRGWLRSNRAGLWWASRRARETATTTTAAVRAKSDRPEM